MLEGAGIAPYANKDIHQYFIGDGLIFDQQSNDRQDLAAAHPVEFFERGSFSRADTQNQVVVRKLACADVWAHKTLGLIQNTAHLYIPHDYRVISHFGQ